MSEQQQKREEARRERGVQLRALVVSWVENKTFVECLRIQQEQIDASEFTPSDDWGMIADEIMAGYLSQPRMTDWDDKEKKDDGPKLVMP